MADRLFPDGSNDARTFTRWERLERRIENYRKGVDSAGDANVYQAYVCLIELFEELEATRAELRGAQEKLKMLGLLQTDVDRLKAIVLSLAQEDERIKDTFEARLVEETLALKRFVTSLSA